MHVIQMAFYPAKKLQTQSARLKIQKYWDDVAAREDYQEGCTGLLSNICWNDKVVPFNSKQDAADYLQSESGKHDYLQMAVLYKEVKPTAKLKELKDKLEEAAEELKKTSSPYYSSSTVKSKFIGCKHCGSKLAVSYIKGNTCPLCGEDLRPESELKRVARLKDKVKKLKENIKTIENRNFELYWLVKVEYHV